MKKIKQQSLIINFGLARGFELAGERLDLTTVVKEEKVNDRLIQAGEANKNGDTSSSATIIATHCQGPETGL